MSALTSPHLAEVLPERSPWASCVLAPPGEEALIPVQAAQPGDLRAPEPSTPTPAPDQPRGPLCFHFSPPWSSHFRAPPHTGTATAVVLTCPQISEELRPPTNSHVRKPLWKGLLSPGSLQMRQCSQQPDRSLRRDSRQSHSASWPSESSATEFWGDSIIEQQKPSNF